MRLVAVPADSHADVIFSAENLRNLRPRSAVFLDLFDQRSEPRWNRISRLQALQRVIVAEPERRHAPLAFECAELKRLERQCRDVADEFALDHRRNERFDMAEPLRTSFRLREERQLLVQVAVLNNASMRLIWEVKQANKDIASMT